MTYLMHQDRGFSWLEVPAQELHDRGLVRSVSRFSFMSLDGTKVYLEGERDANMFAQHMWLHDEAFTTNQRYHRRCFIRQLPPYNPDGLAVQERNLTHG